PAKDGDSKSAEAETRRSRTDAREELRAGTPELAERLARYTAELGLPYEDADVLTGDLALARFFEDALAAYDAPRPVANWVTNEVLRELKGMELAELPFGGSAVGKLVKLIDQGTISATIGKEVFAAMLEGGGSPEQIVRERGLEQIADAAHLEPIVAQVVAANADKAEQYRSGKIGLLGFFIGQVMRATQGKANPQLVQSLVERELG
ncbi:MAG: glutamine--tRNA ligase, partial [Chloroflexota bacterium]|nr:glutamine--tRNA ligase [Chloroflexota bacterium]